MEFIDATALSTALPTLARAFAVDPIHLKLALTSYILALAVFTPASGWAAERFGARRVFLAAMTVFLLGSALCGLSRNLEALVASRVVQGLGGAMMTPVARLIVVGSTPKDKLISAMGWFTVPALLGPLLGPPLAGLVLTGGRLAVDLLHQHPHGRAGHGGGDALRAQGPAPPRHPLRLGGLHPVGHGDQRPGGGGRDLGPEPAALAGAAGDPRPGPGVRLGLSAPRQALPRPILDLSLMRYPTYRASLLGGAFVRLGVGAGPFLLPLLLQVALGWTPLHASLVTIASSLGVLAARPFAAWNLRRSGFRTALALALVLTGLFAAAPGFFTAATPVWVMVILMTLGGFWRSNQFIAANTIAYADVPESSVAAASTLAAVAQQVGLALGVSFGGAMLNLARGAGGALTPDRFTLPYVAVGAVTLLALPLYLALDKDAGASISGRAKH